MPKAPYDVLILGAGAAGLAAAAELAQNASLTGLILEARDRIGGRIWTRIEPDFPLPLELGAEFIHGHAPSTFALLARVGVFPIDTGGRHSTLQHGRLKPRTDDLFEEIQKALKRALPSLSRQDTSFAEFLRNGRRYGLSPDGCRYAQMFVEGFDAAEPERVSARSIAEEWARGGMADSPQFRPAGGYGALMAALERTLAGTGVKLQMQTVVQAIRWRRGEVEIEALFNGQAFHARARRLLVTLPIGVLQLPDDIPGAVRFSPPLPAAKRNALLSLASGPVLKVPLRFRTPFWESFADGRYRNTAFFHAPGFTFPTFWTTLPLRAPLINAWVGGPSAARLSELSDSEIIRQAVDSFQALFDTQRPKGARRCDVQGQLESAWCHNWQQDPFARGAYSYVATAGSRSRATLAKPIDDTLYFAGEASDTQNEGGTVAGALQSGRRAARELLRAAIPRTMRPHRPRSKEST